MKIKKSKCVGLLPPAKDNPRNSEGAFLILEDGRIAFAYSRYSGDNDDDFCDCNIAVVYSSDGGETWSTNSPEILVKASDYGVTNVMSVTLRRMNNGDIGLFYLVKHPNIYTDYHMRRYKGDFSHFLSEVKCFCEDYHSYHVVNNDRIIRHSDGTWFIPAALHHSSTVMENKKEGPISDHNFYSDSRGIITFFVSHDDGATWHRMWETLRMSDTYSTTGFQEPGLVELSGGVIYCYMRTDRAYQYESVSIDGGRHWFMPQPSRFTSPDAPMLIKKNPYSGTYYAIWNPTPISTVNQRGPWVWGRVPLVIAESNDGIHFSDPITIEDDPSKGYCYPAMEFLDEKTVLLGYCMGGEEEGCCLDCICIRKIVLE